MVGEIKSQGTAVYISSEDADATAYASATWKKIGNLREVGEADGEAAEIETTNLESTEEEFMMGIPRNGKYPISGFAKEGDAGQDECLEARGLQQRRWIKAVKSNGAIRYHKALVLKFTDFSATPDGVIPFSGTIRVAGPITRVPPP